MLMGENKEKSEIKLVKADPNLKSYEQLSQKDKVLNPDPRLKQISIRSLEETAETSPKERTLMVDKKLRNIEFKEQNESQQ